jgi:hypothetical protein
MKKKFACPECKGRGQVECSHCGSTIDCDECSHSGLDASLIDIEGFRAACRNAFTDSSWDLVEHDTTVGRTNGVKSIRFGAFRHGWNQWWRDPLWWIDAQPSHAAIIDPLAWLDYPHWRSATKAALLEESTSEKGVQ